MVVLGLRDVRERGRNRCEGESVAATVADREAREETRERAVACEESENILRER